jgi:tRNA threonylcarbamoyladenosine biosynthesis protein TsaE
MQRAAQYDQKATETLGARIAALLRPGDAILLEGPLGAGKTTLARALIRSACQNPGLEIPSPSYTLVQSYETPNLTIHHFDLWRLDGPDALAELGWDDATSGVVLVEWPDRLGNYKPADALAIKLSLAEGHTRLIEIEGWEERLGEQCLPPQTPRHYVGDAAHGKLTT